MRVVYDYGLSSGGARRAPSPVLPTGDGDAATSSPGREAVMIIRIGDRARDKAQLSGALPIPETAAGDGGGDDGDSGTSRRTGAAATGDDGLRLTVAGRDWLLTVSPEARDRERAVRHHEQAHARTLGAYAASAIAYQTQRGPDGQRYVTGGSIRADLSEVPGDPRATLRKARTVIAAAYAVGDPSAADMRVAAEAYRLARDASAELREIARA